MPRACVKIELYEPIGSYSHAVVAAGQSFISGTAGVDPASGALLTMNAVAIRKGG